MGRIVIKNKGPGDSRNVLDSKEGTIQIERTGGITVWIQVLSSLIKMLFTSGANSETTFKGTVSKSDVQENVSVLPEVGEAVD